MTFAIAKDDQSKSQTVSEKKQVKETSEMAMHGNAPYAALVKITKARQHIMLVTLPAASDIPSATPCLPLRHCVISSLETKYSPGLESANPARHKDGLGAESA
jgi:hypothetical protein